MAGYIRETFLEGVDWIHLAQGRDQWRAVVFGHETGLHGTTERIAL